jgi:hypothetical protein
VRTVVGVLRLVVAAVGTAALVSYFFYTLGFSTFSTVNYFAYFTQQSNMANVIVLAVSGALSLRGRPEGRAFAAVHALVTTYVVVSGIVYGIILIESLSNDFAIGVPWSTQVLHFWIPGFLVVDWVLAPGRTRVSWAMLSVVLVFPVVWGIATIVRGADVGWYPYFFLDPAQVRWPDEFVMYNAIALGVIVGVMSALIALSHLRPGPRPGVLLRRGEGAALVADDGGSVPPPGGRAAGAGLPGAQPAGGVEPAAPGSAEAGSSGAGVSSGTRSK